MNSREQSLREVLDELEVANRRVLIANANWDKFKELYPYPGGEAAPGHNKAATNPRPGAAKKNAPEFSKMN